MNFFWVHSASNYSMPSSVSSTGKGHTGWSFSQFIICIYLLAFFIYSVQSIWILSTIPRSAKGVAGLHLQTMDPSLPQVHPRWLASPDDTCSYQRPIFSCQYSNSEILGHVGVMLWMWFCHPQIKDEGSWVWLDCWWLEFKYDRVEAASYPTSSTQITIYIYYTNGQSQCIWFNSVRTTSVVESTVLPSAISPVSTTLFSKLVLPLLLHTPTGVVSTRDIWGE